MTPPDHTMLRGAWLAKPIITSDWPILRDYFVRGTVHVDNTTAGIRDGIRRLMSEYYDFVQEIGELRRLRIADWQTRREELMDLFARAEAKRGGRRAGGR